MATPQENPAGHEDGDDDYSSVLAAYHRSLISGTSEEFDPGVASGLGGAVDCLRMLERQRQLTHSSLDQSTMPTAGRTAADESIAAEAKSQPGRIGRFEIIRKIGSGGSGVVMLARDPELDRQIALKVPTPDSLLREEFVERFQREGALAARLKHPHIVSVLENGSIGPICYLATEFCNGPNLHQWFEGKPPVSPQAAAELLRVLASAVQHAHSRGILHRDIKPSNILFELDATHADQPLHEGQLAAAARLADFGLAKNLTDSANITAPAAILGTPSYMSPEQASADAADVGTHSDVFSLGVILYELLTGISPFKRETALATVQAVKDFRPRGVSSLRPDVPADLAAICQKCVEKRPDDRYSSAAALEEDLANFLTNRPVIARPISRTRRSWRWMRRNPLLAGMAGLVVTLTVLIAIGSSIATIQLTHTQRQLEAEAANKAAVSNYLSAEILGQASPFVNPNRQLTLVEALEHAARRLEGHFDEHPLVEAEIRLTLGRTFQQLAKFHQAELHLSQAYKLLSKELGSDHPDTLVAAYEQAFVQFESNSIEAARAAWNDISRRQRAALGESHPDTLRTQSYLAFAHALLRQYDDAAPLFERTEAAYVKLLGEDHPDTLDCLDNKARMLQFQEKYAEAEALHSHILKVRRTALGEFHPHYQDSLSALAYVKMMRGDAHTAVELFDEVIELRRQTLGDDHPDTLAAKGVAAKALYGSNAYDSAEQMYTATLAAQRKRFGVDDNRTLSTMRSLASLYKARGKYEAAEDLLTEVLESRRRIHGDHAFTVSGLRRLAGIYLYQKRYDEAEKLHREMIEIETRLHGADSQPVYDAMQHLGYCLQEARRYTESEELATKLLQRHTALYGRQHRKTVNSVTRLAWVKWKQKKFSEAEPLFREAWQHSPEFIGPTRFETLKVGNGLGDVLIRLGRLDEAESIIQEVLSTRIQHYGQNHRQVRYSFETLAILRKAQGNLIAVAEVDEQRFRVCRKVYGDAHEITFDAAEDWRTAVEDIERTGQSEIAQPMRERFVASQIEIADSLLAQPLDKPANAARLLHIIAFRLRLRSTGRVDDAERILKDLVERQTRLLGRHHEETLRSLHELAFLYKVADRNNEADQLFREIWEHVQTAWGPDDRDTLRVGRNYSNVLRRLDKLSEAESLSREVLDRRAAIFGEFHRDTAESLLDLATLQERLGKTQEAADLQVQFAVVQTKRQGNTSRAVKAALKKLAEFAAGREERGDWAQAIALREKMHRLTVEIFGEVHDETTRASALLSRAEDQAGR